MTVSESIDAEEYSATLDDCLWVKKPDGQYRGLAPVEIGGVSVLRIARRGTWKDSCGCGRALIRPEDPQRSC